MLEEFWIEYQSNSIKRYEKEFPGSVEALDRLMTKDQIAVATVFRCIPQSELKSTSCLSLLVLVVGIVGSTLTKQTSRCWQAGSQTPRRRSG
jgi:hypothetical protein